MKAARKLQRLAATAVVDRLRPTVSHPTVWKQARQAVPRRRGRRRAGTSSRWSLVLLAMTWAAGDSQPERFEMARGFYVACLRGPQAPRQDPRRDSRRPWAALPMRQFRALAAGVRHEIRARSPSGCSSTASSRWAATARGSSAPAPPSWRPGSDRPARTTRPPPSG